MNVSLVSVTKPLIDDLRTAEDLIVYIARVSNPSNQLNLDTGHKLIKHCLKNEHWSVFEQVMLTVEVTTSRMISAQILRHKSFFFQEFSQRYSEVTEVEPIEIRRQAEKNRQSSTDVMNDPYCDAIVAQTVASSMDGYKKLLNRGAARECARAVLPMASRTVMYMTGTLRSWLHYAILRSKPNTQKEHRLIAEAVIPILAWQFPITCNASVEVAKEDYIKKTRVKDQRDRLLSIATDMWIYGRNRNNESAPKWREAQERFESLEKEIMEHDNGQS